jgi:plastocyanin
VLAGLLLVACAGPARPAHPTTVEVHLTCATGILDAPCGFRPAEVTVPAGGTVRWVDDDATYHTVTSSARADVRMPDGQFDAVLDVSGETFTHTFAEPGTYPYYCQPHAEFMAGTVVVVAR